MNTAYQQSPESRSHDLLKKLNINVNLVPVTEMSLRYSTTNFNIHSTLATTQKASRSNEQWIHLYHDLSNQFSDSKKIFTDGSDNELGKGCGVWSENFSLQAKLPNHCSIFTAELAICNSYGTPIHKTFLQLC